MKLSRQTMAFFACGIIGLAGCSATPEYSPAPVSRPPVPSAPPSTPYSPPAASPAPAPEAPVYRPVANDQCGAAGLQYLIGKPRTDIPVPLHPETRRVVCSTCVMTQEYRSDRQTIIFDTDTGLVSSVKCG